MIYELVFVLVFCGLIVYSIRTKIRSANEMETLAKSLGATFNEKTVGFGRHGAFPAMPESALLSEFTGQASWVVSGRVPAAEYRLFNFHESSVDNSTNTTVALLKTDGLSPLPAFHIHPANLQYHSCFTFHKQQVDLPAYPRFMQLFKLLSPDAAVRAVFDVPMAIFFEQHEGIYAEKFGPYLAYYRFEKRIGPGEGRVFFDEAFALLDALQNSAARVRR